MLLCHPVPATSHMALEPDILPAKDGSNQCISTRALLERVCTTSIQTQRMVGFHFLTVKSALWRKNISAEEVEHELLAIREQIDELLTGFANRLELVYGDRQNNNKADVFPTTLACSEDQAHCSAQNNAATKPLSQSSQIASKLGLLMDLSVIGPYQEGEAFADLKKTPDLSLIQAVESSHNKLLLLFANEGVPLGRPLIQQNNDDSYAETTTTLLEYAVRHDANSCVEELVKAGVNVDATCNLQRSNPLLTACSIGNTRAAQVLVLAGANINVVSVPSCMTPLMFSSAKGHLSIVRMLSSALSKNSLNARDEKGYCAVHHAAIYGQNEILTVLQDAGAGINEVDNLHNTPIMLAMRKGHFSTIQLLLERGACLSGAEDLVVSSRHHARLLPLVLGQPPAEAVLAELLLRAIARRRRTAVQALLAAGAEEALFRLRGTSALIAAINTVFPPHAAGRGRGRGRPNLYDEDELTWFLGGGGGGAGVDALRAINRPDAAGLTPLGHALRARHGEAVRFLLATQARLGPTRHGLGGGGGGPGGEGQWAALGPVELEDLAMVVEAGYARQQRQRRQGGGDGAAGGGAARGGGAGAGP